MTLHVQECLACMSSTTLATAYKKKAQSINTFIQSSTNRLYLEQDTVTETCSLAEDSKIKITFILKEISNEFSDTLLRQILS